MGYRIPKGFESLSPDRQKHFLGTTQNGFLLYPHAEEYQPGRGQNQGDLRVASLNRDLLEISEGVQSTQRLFAVWHDPNQKLAQSGLHGIVVWATSGRDDGFALPLGNPATERTGQMEFRGLPDRHKILEFFAAMGRLDPELREGADKQLKKLTGDDKREKAELSKLADHREGVREAVLEGITLDAPSRTDRTVAHPGMGTTKEKHVRRKREQLGLPND